MVQLSPSQILDIAPQPERSEHGKERLEDLEMADTLNLDSPCVLTSLLSLEATTTYYGYDNYIEDGLICLKHKVRNLEKKKLKLEDYKKRLYCGEELNKDQMAAVERYEEVLHNLAFAREMHKTLDILTQNLLRAQKKAMKKEQVEREEAERRRLTTVLQVQHLLHSLQQEHIRRDLLAGCNQAPHMQPHQLQSLSQLSSLLGVQSDKTLSVEEQMEQASLVYLDLLEGKDKSVAGSTFKLLKAELTRLLNCKYFSRLPLPSNKSPEVLLRVNSHSATSKPKPHVSKEFFNRRHPTDVETAPTQNWKEDFQSTREQEPPDCWDMEFSDGHASPQAAINKPWRGAATFIPKGPISTKKHADSERRKERRAKREQHAKLTVDMDMPMDVFNSPHALPKDPLLRKQHLEDFMTKIHGSFSFMQDSLLDGEISPTHDHPRLMRQSGSLSPLANLDQAHSSLRSPVSVLSKAMHSTPLPTRLKECEASLKNMDQCLETCDLKLSSKDTAHEPLLAERKTFSSPPLYCRDPTITVSHERSCTRTPVTESGKQSPSNNVATLAPPQEQTFSTPPTRRTLAQFQNIQSIHSDTDPSLQVLTSSEHTMRQTLTPQGPKEELVFKVTLPQKGEMDYKPDCAVFDKPRYSTASTQTPPEFAPSEDEAQLVYQSDYTMGNGGPIIQSPGQSCYTKASVRGGSFSPQAHLKDTGPLLYAAGESEYQCSYRRGAGRHNSSAAWSDSSQVSTSDQEGAFTIVDSGHGDSLEVPLTPHGQHHALLPMHIYPLSQPLRVAFNVSRTANFAPGNLDQPIVFDQMHSNLGEMFDTHIGRFTCPVNGTYVFIFHILKLAINVPLYINLMRNEEVMVSAYANDGAPDHETASNHAILPLFQGDQVWLRLHRGAIYGSTWKYSTFSGFLLYQD